MSRRPASTRRVLAVAITSALLSAFVGGYATPAQAAPVLATDTLRSGAGLAFGANDKGQTNPSSQSPTSLGAKPLPSGTGGNLADAVSIAAGKGFTSWVDHKGSVWGLGDNAYGQGGNGSAGGTLRTPVKALGFGGSGQPKAVKASAFGLATLVLDDAGAVWQWGNVVNSQGNNQVSATPTKVTFPSGTARIVDVSAGDAFALALDDAGKAYSWGKNDRGQLGLGTNNTSPSPARITSLPPLAAGAQANLEAGRDFAVYTISSATGVTVYTWGRGDCYQLGAGTSTANSKSPKLIGTFAAPAKVLSLSAGTAHTLLLTNDGVLRTWGSNGLTSNKTPTVQPDPSGLLSGSHHPYTVAAGDGASLAASTDGTIAAWGTDTTGQLGRTTTGTLSVPTLVSVPGTVPPSLYGVPATITSRNGATYVVVDGQAARTPQASYDLGAFPTAAAAGQTAPTVTVVFTSTATKPLTISSLVVDGANPSDFTLSGSTCTGTLPVDGTCAVTVTFQPTGTGARQAGVILRTSNTLGGVPLYAGFGLTGRGYAAVPGVGNLSLDLDQASPTSVSGPGNVIDLRTLNPSLIPISSPPTPSAQLGKVQLGKVQLGKVQLGKVQLGKVQLGKVQLGKVQLGKVPLSIQLGKVQLGKVQLGKVQLGKVPLTREGGWTAVLQAYPKLRNLPISSLTLADLVDPNLNTPDSTTDALPLERVTLGDLDLRSSVFGRLSMLSVLTAGLRLDQYSNIDWCADLPKVPNGGSCTDGAGLSRTLFDLDLANQVPVELTRAGSTTVGQLVTDALSTTTSAVDDALFSQLLIKGEGIALSGTRIGQLPLSSIPTLTDVLTCTNGYCTDLAGKTLGDAELAGQVQDDATYKSLGTALNPVALASLVEPFLDRGAFDWESLPVSEIPLQAYPNRLTLVADVDVNCNTASGTTLGVKLPTGFQYVPGTTTLTRTRGTGTVPLADPTPDPSRGLVVAVPDSSYSATGPIACTDDAAHLTVKLGVLPTKTPGTAYKATADVRTTSVAPVTATQARAVTVTGIEDLPSLSPASPFGAPDQLVIGSVAPGQVKYVPFHVTAAGKTVEATVSNQTADIDAVLYYPKGSPQDVALSAQTATSEVPFGEAAAIEPDVLHPTRTALGGALQDVPLLGDRPVAAVAATRGTDVEQLGATSRIGTDDVHVLALSGFNGTGGSFTTRLRVIDALQLAGCVAPPVTPTSAPASAFYGPATALPAGANTLVLVNRSRLEGTDGVAGAKAALDALEAFTHPTAGQTTGVKGEVLQVDSSQAVRDAYAAWDAAPCDPLAADGVVKAVNVFAAPYFGKDITNVVLVGGDRLLPHARLEDHTRDGSEREEAADVAFKGGNPLASSFAAGYYLSDDPYGTKRAQTVVGQVVYLPQALPQRLGESALEIAAQVDQFVASNGVADPQTASGQPRTAVVTDYDFLTKGGDATASSLTAAGYGTDHTLSGQDTRWTRAQLYSAWLDKTGSIPSVAALNMHYDQYRGLPALGDATNDLTDVYRSADAAQANLSRRVVFTVGCHSALDVPDVLADAGDARALDFAQAYSRAGTAAMIGNLGFGYADDSAPAYSVRQQQLIADGFAKGYDVGTSLLQAKRRYLTTLAGLSAYDLKATQQTVLWGLGAYRLKGGPAAAPPVLADVTPAVDPVSGVPSRTVSVGTQANPLQFTQVTTDGSVHDVVSATDPAVSDKAPASVSIPGRPVLGAQFVSLPNANGLRVHGVAPVSVYFNPAVSVTATSARPGTDEGLDQERLTTGSFPSSTTHLGSVLDVNGVASSTLVYTPEEIVLSGTTPGAGMLQRFPHSSLMTFYGPAGADHAPLYVTNVFGTSIPASGSASAATAITADVTATGGRTVKRVFALARPASGSGASVLVEMTKDPSNPNHWSGGYPALLGSFDVYAVNDYGDVGKSTLKGGHFLPRLVPPSIDPALGVAISLPAPDGSNGWFLYDPNLTLTGPNAGFYKYRVNGGPLQDSGSVVIGDGGQVVEVVDTRTGQSVGGGVVKIDKVVPTVQIVSTLATPYRLQLNENLPFTLVTHYGASGQASLTDTGRALGTGRGYVTSAVGATTLSATATSVAGSVGTASQPYRVIYGQGPDKTYGFLNPVLNLPLTDPDSGLNLVLRNTYYEFSYHLSDVNGTPVTGSMPVAGNVFSFAPITCPSSGADRVQLPKILGPDTVNAAPGSTAGDWHLDVSMTPAAGCYAMTLLLNDGYTSFSAAVQIT